MKKIGLEKALSTNLQVRLYQRLASKKWTQIGSYRAATHVNNGLPCVLTKEAKNDWKVLPRHWHMLTVVDNTAIHHVIGVVHFTSPSVTDFGKETCTTIRTGYETWQLFKIALHFRLLASEQLILEDFQVGAAMTNLEQDKFDSSF